MHRPQGVDQFYLGAERIGHGEAVALGQFRHALLLGKMTGGIEVTPQAQIAVGDLGLRAQDAARDGASGVDRHDFNGLPGGQVTQGNSQEALAIRLQPHGRIGCLRQEINGGIGVACGASLRHPATAMPG